ncbi:hypothetical protein TTHERM_00327250 (macronuclear) [Tetrahymena thermophila SB210]|uniref:Uncharacterized protein n=1 Tax=Tetrahymena thermophila (strain SB210) TaxID=312017 RepID=I7MAV9_TETTS|nr:hypothetical protein TTHERM_00327250 [Tetrahymena thermophila SB210]EAS06243.2 hypothetical protein TTHERM_00327250 [Tetrahymena thermophila SB210]|eukprot:XP_001026488.2 hypothetical protein TTHERM_00327250 [Tetrahymena thermophila SB210]
MNFIPFELNTEETKQLEQQQTQAEFQDQINAEEDFEKQNSHQIICFQQKNNGYKQAEFISINPCLYQNQNTLNIMTGLFITNDGILRFSASLDPISLGYQQQIVQLVEEKKNLGVINIQMRRNEKFHKNNIKDAINFMQKVQNCDYNKVFAMLSKNYMMQEFLNSQLAHINMDNLQIEKDKEFLKFINFCYNYIDLYNQNNPNQMYWYSIGRLNLQLQDLENVQMGYSKAYLELLGLDINSLQQIFLRNKQVDLLSKKEDITSQSIQALEVIEKSLYEEIYQSSITTFDGFTIKIIQKKRNLNNLFKSNYIINNLTCEYILTFTEIDVDIYELEQLIDYRQRISQNCQKQQQNLDDLIKRELSFRFEDVEYSVQSQNFVEKYYNQNIQYLKQQKYKFQSTN